MKRLLLPLLCLLLLSGCWDHKDTNALLIVAGAALDLDEEGHTCVTAEVLSFAQSGSADAESHLLRGKGETLFDAFGDLLKKSGKELYWQHSAVLILGRAYAEKGLGELFDCILNNNEFRLTLDLAVSGLEKAGDVFSLDPLDRKIISFAVDRRIYEGEKLGYTIRKPAFGALNAFLSGLRDFALPLVREGEDGVIEVSGCAAFREGKMVGTIDAVQAQQIQLLDSMLADMELSFHTPELSCAVHLGSFRPKIELSQKEGCFLADVHVDAQYEVLMCVEENPMPKSARTEKIEALCRDRLCLVLEETNRHFAALSCDLFGWGERVYRKEPDAYEKDSRSFAEKIVIRPEFSLHERLEGLSGAAVDQEGGG